MAENKDNSTPYVVLARKYRPQVFEDLLGQDALVKTLKNAIENNRLHHAYILTGIRGVGKTTTARLIARALNCTGLDGKSGPTIHPCGQCENCQAIANGRHIDVLELDAASRTGVDDMRELLAGVQYKPTNARYKVYIIDEVHMLSKGAFNALLKTLEEPPAHVKFIFATTEIRKVPVTILSRCQRFDLERLTIPTLMELFHKILKAEKITADDEALEMIAKAADGSARDGLSILDQAIVLSGGKVKFEIVRDMIGLADRTKTLALFEYLLQGDMAKVLENVHEQYQHGAHPSLILNDLIEIVHMLTKAKVVPDILQDEMMSENDKNLCEKLSASLSVAVLSKMWQMLLKGIDELNLAPYPQDALDMVLIRTAYGASLPTPAELLEELKKKPTHEPIKITLPQHKVDTTPQTTAASVSIQQPILSPKMPAQTNHSITDIQDLTSYLEAHKKMILLYALKNDVSIDNISDGAITLTVCEKTAPDFVPTLSAVLKEATGSPWNIDVKYGTLGKTLNDIEKEANEANKQKIIEYPLIKTILNEFKGIKFDTVLRVSNTSEDDEQEQINNIEEEETYV
ncbi:MAG: DNA polymerase III subunit gamma/tau [Alphaproteobacteria bacterium]|nr:DNA polymerase III subunit gamma/tau [Alphaproteobacteria bacterium]